MINGLVNVYKEKGFTSFDACAVMRGIFGQRKVGHMGTLDPNAEGVLPICLGNATKLCDMLNDRKKEYIAVFLLGKETDTLDIWGNVINERAPKVSEEELRDAIMSFEGGYEQLPPMYSAKKIDGKRLYDIARSGREVERKPVFVDIYEIEIMDISMPYATIRVSCGKGTYIRSLCADIAFKCGEIACMTALKRTQVAEFTIDKSYTLTKLTKLKQEGRLESVITPTDFCFMDYGEIHVKKEFKKYIDNGNKLTHEMLTRNINVNDKDIVRVYNTEGDFTGLYEYNAPGRFFKPFKMFM